MNKAKPFLCLKTKKQKTNKTKQKICFGRHNNGPPVKYVHILILRNHVYVTQQGGIK